MIEVSPIGGSASVAETSSWFPSASSGVPLP